VSTLTNSPGIGAADVKAAVGRVAGRIVPVTVGVADPGDFGTGSAADAARVFFAYEFMQHTGTFKARGAANLAAYHVEQGTMPDAGIVIASGGNAGLACAWAAKATGTAATVFVPENAPAFKVAKLRAYGADVRQVGNEYAHALEASIDHAARTGALLSHAYDNPFVAAGAGTCASEIIEALGGEIDTIIVAVGGGGLFSGTCAAVEDTHIKVVAVEPEGSRALNAALESGGPVDVTVDSIAADSLGARRVSQMAYEFARRDNAHSVLVTDAAIIQARQALWDQRRIVSEYGGATALAALVAGAYVPEASERVVIVLCGANTDPGDLVHTA
jgi:threonine dehydratase